jgi:hypothetical protein
MTKFVNQNTKLDDNEKVQLGDSSEGEATHDGTALVISTSADINISINSGVGGSIIISDMNYPTADGTVDQILKTDGVDIMSWQDVGVDPPVPPGDRGVWAGGWHSPDSYVNNIDYITISTTGNADNFGDLTEARRQLAGTSNGSSGRAVWGGGLNVSTVSNIIDYRAILSAGNASDWGDLTEARNLLAGTSNGTNDRGVFGGGYTGARSNTIDYITISTPSTCTNFGDLQNEAHSTGSCSNGTNNRGVWAGGRISGDSVINVIDYVTISSAGNAANFGDLTASRDTIGACSNGTNNRGIFAGGFTTGYTRLNVIDYITISSAGNAANFGDLSGAVRSSFAGTSNGTNGRGVFGGGGDDAGDESNVIDYVTISSASNSTDFGDLTLARTLPGACSNG